MSDLIEGFVSGFVDLDQVFCKKLTAPIPEESLPLFMNGCHDCQLVHEEGFERCEKWEKPGFKIPFPLYGCSFRIENDHCEDEENLLG